MAVPRVRGRVRRPVVAMLFHLCLILAVAVPGWSQDAARGQTSKDLADIPLEDLMNIDVYGASKFSQKASEAPATVSIVTAEQIQRFGYRTLSDLLRSLNGFFVNSDRNYSYVEVRGFAPPGDYNGRILLLVDGHRLNDNVFDQALIGAEFPIDLDQVERVEIIRGPSSSLYGTNAFFAVINVITKKRSSVGHGDVSFDAASFGSYKGHFAYGATLFQQLNAYLAGTIYDSSGHNRLYYKEFDNPVTNNGFAVNCDDESSRDFLANLSFRGFKLQAIYGSREKGIPTASYGTVFDDPRARTIDTRAYVDLMFERSFGNEWGIMSRIAYDRYIYTGYYPYAPAAYGTPGDVLNYDYADGEWLSWEGQLKKRLGQRHRLILGTELRDNLRQDQRNYNTNPYGLFLNTEQSSLLGAVYAQDEFRIANPLILSAGLRHDQYSTFGGATNPRVGLIYSPVEKTKLKLLYGQAFRAPNAYELFYELPGSAKPNPYLQPETIRTYEAAVDQYIGGHLRLSGSGYAYRIKDLIVQQLDPADSLLLFQNAERVRSKGLEFEAEGKWRSGLEMRFSYAVQESRDEQTGLTLSNSPKHLGKTNLMVPLVTPKLLAGIEGQYMSPRKSIAGNTVGGFFIANLTLFAQRIAPGLDLSGSVYNVFDKRYADPGGQELVQTAIPQDGRSFRVKMAYSF